LFVILSAAKNLLLYLPLFVLSRHPEPQAKDPDELRHYPDSFRLPNPTADFVFALITAISLYHRHHC